MATFNKAVLRAVLQSRRLSAERLSARAGVPFSKFSQELSREQGPSQSLVNSIAKELSVPPFTFFMREAPKFETNIPDFRHPNPTATEKSRSTIESIQTARAIQDQATKLELLSEGVDLPTLSLNQNVVEAAGRVRKFFEIEIADQKGAKDTRIFYYLCRQKIEAKQIFVIQDSFPSEDGSGYALWSKFAPVIIVNSHNQNYARRLFTLVHELAHILLKQTGISDPFKQTNSIERFCNSFAAEFLVPKNHLSDLLGGLNVARKPTTDDIKRIANRLKFSQEASVVRLEELGLVEAGSHEAWLKAISNFGNPDFKKGGGGSGRPPEEKIKLAKYGFLFAATFERAIGERRISVIELYRVAGIKPKWLKSFFEYAKSNDLEGIEDA